MEFRSTNDQGYTHLKGDLISNVSSGGVQNSSHGVHLTGSNTGGIVQAAGDETDIRLIVRGKGAGGVSFGSTAQSTTAVAFIERYRVDWTVPALSSAGLDASFGDSTITVTGATTNSIYVFQERVNLNSTNSTGLFVSRVRCSTANEIRLTVANGGASTISGSTMSGYLLQIGF